jgi:hypothetical protein
MSKLSANWSEDCVLKPASIIALIVACATIFLGVIDFSAAHATEQVVSIKCPDEKHKKVILLPSTDKVIFQLETATCYCTSSAEDTKKYALLAKHSDKRGVGVSTTSMPAETIDPGSTRRHTWYCYTADQVRQFHTVK